MGLRPHRQQAPDYLVRVADHVHAVTPCASGAHAPSPCPSGARSVARAGSKPGSSAATLTATGRCLILFSVIMAGVAYFSGPLVFESLETELEAVRDLVELHAVLGRAAFFGLVFLAIPTMFAIFRELEDEPPSCWLNGILIAGTALLSYLLLWAGHYGGAIRRPEIANALSWLFPIL